MRIAKVNAHSTLPPSQRNRVKDKALVRVQGRGPCPPEAQRCNR